MSSLGDVEVMNSKEVMEYLNITSTNLRQLVWRKELTPLGREKKRSLFAKTEIEARKNRKQPVEVTPAE